MIEGSTPQWAAEAMRAFRPATLRLCVEREGRAVEYRVNIEREPVLLIAGLFAGGWWVFRNEIHEGGFWRQQRGPTTTS